MRLIKRLQLFLRPEKTEIAQGHELDEISRVLDEAPGIKEAYVSVLHDVNHGKSAQTGRNGLTAEQIIKLGVLRSRYDASYRELEHMSGDSMSVRRFLNLAPGQVLSKSAINSSLKSLTESTMKKINDCLKSFALREGIEDGKAVRGDTTTTKTNIHYPTDASLLDDAVRVLTRPMNRLKEWFGVEFRSSDHHRRAKKKLYKINNSRKERVRHDCYLELIRVTRMTVKYAEGALVALRDFQLGPEHSLATFLALEEELKHYIPLAKQVIDQAYRRIVLKEKLPAAEKIFSIFEPETDIIIKGQREIVFGHKVLMVTGKSSLILQLETLDGNPADSSLVEPLLTKHSQFYKTMPRDVAFDGGFASIDNRDFAKAGNVANLTFSKNGNMPLDTLVTSKQKHRTLMCFRAGIEGCISFFKRIFGATKILDRSKETFKTVMQIGVVAYNLTLIARHRLRKATT